MDTTGQHIDRFHYYTQFILPLVYDDSLSYYEVLAKVTHKLNEVIDWANNYRDELKAYVDQKTLENLTTMRAELAAYKTTVDAQLSNMQQQLDGLIAEVDKIISDFQEQINKQISDFQNELNAQLAQLKQELANFEQQITSQIEQNELWVKAQILQLQAKVNAQLAVIQMQMENNKEFGKMYTDSRIDWVMQQLPKYQPVPVISPITGKLTPLQKVLYEITEAARVWAVTCIQYDLIGLTCDEYDGLAMTCYKYDWFAWYYLGPYKQVHLCFSELSGRLLPIQRCVHELWQFQRASAVTCADYDAEDLTTDDYDQLDITAYQYNWQALPTGG